MLTAEPDPQNRLRTRLDALPPLTLPPPLQLPLMPPSAPSAEPLSASSASSAWSAVPPAAAHDAETERPPPSVASSVSLLRKASAFFPKLLSQRSDPPPAQAPASHTHVPGGLHHAQTHHTLLAQDGRLHHPACQQQQMQNVQMDMQMHLQIPQTSHLAIIPTPDSDATDPNFTLFSLQKHYKAIMDFEDVVISNDPDEYGYDIFNYMLQVEQQTLARSSLMDHQSEINWKMRKTLVLWLIEVQVEYDLRQETLYVTINIIDRMCSRINVARSRYQLLGIAALWIAAKYEENHGKVPTIQNLVHMCCRTYREPEILAMERTILRELEFRLGVPTQEAFLKAFYALRAGNNVSPESRAMARYIMELSLIYRRFVGEKPSDIAHASLFLAEEVVGNRRWYDHDRTELYNLMQKLYECLKDPPRQIFEKFSSDKFLNSSELARTFMLAQRIRCARRDDMSGYDAAMASVAAASASAGGQFPGAVMPGGDGHPTPPKEVFAARWHPHDYANAAATTSAIRSTPTMVQPALVPFGSISAMPSSASFLSSSSSEFEQVHSDPTLISGTHGYYHQQLQPQQLRQQVSLRSIPPIPPMPPSHSANMLHPASAQSTTASDLGVAMMSRSASIDNLSATFQSSLSASGSTSATASLLAPAAPSPALINCFWNMLPMQNRSSSAAPRLSKPRHQHSQSVSMLAPFLDASSSTLTSLSEPFNPQQAQVSGDYAYHFQHQNLHHPYTSHVQSRPMEPSALELPPSQSYYRQSHVQQQHPSQMPFMSYGSTSMSTSDAAMDVHNAHIWAM